MINLGFKLVVDFYIIRKTLFRVDDFLPEKRWGQGTRKFAF